MFHGIDVFVMISTFDYKMYQTNLDVLKEGYSAKKMMFELCSYILASLGVPTNILVVFSNELSLRRESVNMFIIHQVRTNYRNKKL